MTLNLCLTCQERLAERAGECHACYQYRRRTGGPRPKARILAHLERRSLGIGQVGPSNVLHELRVTLLHVGTVVPGTVEICAACGTIKAWIEGKPIPLCIKHRGWLALAGAMLDEPWDQDRIRDALIA